jgi:DNA topoisomerase IB
MIAASPFLERAKSLRYFIKSPCGVGQNPGRDKCTKADGEGGGERKGPESSISINVLTNNWRGRAMSSLVEREHAQLSEHRGIRQILDKYPVRVEIGSGELADDGGEYNDGVILLSTKFSESKRYGIGGDVRVTDESQSGAFRHEFGHHLAQATRVQDGAFLNAVSESMKSEGLNFSRGADRRSWLSKHISKYASTNMEEAFCEAFAGYTHKDYGKKGKLPPKIEKVMEQILTGGEKTSEPVEPSPSQKLGSPAPRPTRQQVQGVPDADVKKLLKMVRDIAGRYNFGSLSDLRSKLPWPRETADKVIGKALWDGYITLPQSEGRSVGGKPALSEDEEKASFRDNQETGGRERTYAHIILNPEGERRITEPEAPRVGPTPFENRAKSLPYFTKAMCEVGQTAASTDCTPASKESSHEAPVKRRAEKGKLFAAKREGKGKEAKVVMADGSPAPPHIKPAMIPPAWSRVKVSMDPEADILVQGKMKNKKGQWANKTVYNEKYLQNNQAAKFGKIHEALSKKQEIADQIQRARNDPTTKEVADVVWLIEEQGTRPDSGGEEKGVEELYGQLMTADNIVTKKDKKGKVSMALKFGDRKIPLKDEGVKAELSKRMESGDLEDSTFWLKSFGASSLEGRHVVESPDGVRLRFVGKETKFHDHLIHDSEMAKMLLDRKKAAGDKGKLFNTDYGKVLKWTKLLDGGGYTPKDLRTLKGTSMAIEEIKNMGECCDSPEEYKTAVTLVAEKVSSVLGNTPDMALMTYISPEVWSVWNGAEENPIGEKSLEYQTKNQGHWVTLENSGTHVFIGEGGQIEKGPESLVNQSVDDIKPKVGPSPMKDRPKVEPPRTESKVKNKENNEKLPGINRPSVAFYEEGNISVKKHYQTEFRAFFGKDIDEGTVAAMVNAVDGASVTVEFLGNLSYMKAETSRTGVHAERTFYRRDGKVFVRNNLFTINPTSPHKGHGVRLFVNQVQALRNSGVDHIETYASGNGQIESEYNGYYTWPRMGYDGVMEEFCYERLPEELRQKLGNSRSVLDLMALPGGKAAWKEYGASFQAKFDLHEGSRSMKVLEDYVEERRQRGEVF